LNRQINLIPGKWQEGIGIVPSAYRWLAFAIATAQIFLFPSALYSLMPPVFLVTAVGIYTLLKTLRPFRCHENGVFTFGILGTDLAVCIFLIISTGGLYSPFLLYTLAPVLTAALLLDRGITFGITALSGAYVIGAHLANPFFSTQLFLPELSYFLVYIIAASLAAALPYLINVNLRQRLQSEDILRERQRLSREIHDQVVQSVATLHWQAQLVHRHLIEIGVNLDEVTELVRLAAKAHQDTRECLELLRSYTGNSSFLPHLKDYLKHLNHDTDIDFSLNPQTGELRLEAPVELQLLRICQEALTNIRSHSKAHNVEITLKHVAHRLTVTIADDGIGFDALAYYHNGAHSKGHGLAVMQERAESVGGRFRVVSMPGRGTEVQVEVPAKPSQGRSLWPKL
jgi:signal transduction histidine kinase